MPNLGPRATPTCERCDGDGYVDVVGDWGEVIGPAPCPKCSSEDPFDAIDALIEARDDFV